MVAKGKTHVLVLLNTLVFSNILKTLIDCCFQHFTMKYHGIRKSLKPKVNMFFVIFLPKSNFNIIWNVFKFLLDLQNIILYTYLLFFSIGK